MLVLGICLMVIGMLTSFIAAGLDGDDGAVLASFISIVCLVLGTIFMSDHINRTAHVREGRATWVQVIQDDGTVKNEFQWKEFKNE